MARVSNSYLRFVAWHRLLLAVLVPLIAVSCRETNIDDVIRDAVTYAKAGGADNWEEAHRRLHDCIHRGVTDPRVVNLYILSLIRTHQHDEALRLATEFQRDHPDEFVTNYLLGELHLERGELEEATRFLRLALTARPEHFDTKIVLASCAGSLNLPEAGQRYTDLFDLPQFSGERRETALVHNELAVWYVQQGKYLPAMSHFSQAVELSDENPLIYLNMAKLADYHLKKPEVARKYYLRFLFQSNDEHPERKQWVQNRLRRIP